MELSRSHEAAFVAAIVTVHLLAQAGIAQAIAPCFIIGDTFGTSSPNELSWYAAAYALTVGTFILPSGRLGDIYGHKRLLIIGWLWFAWWSLLAGFSVYVRPGNGGQISFDIARAMQGIGPAILMPNALAILGKSYEEGKKKNMAFALFGATAPGGFVLGAVFSSLFAEFAWWPWAFWVMSCVCAAMAIVSAFVVPEACDDNSHGTAAGGGGSGPIWERLDLGGMISGVVGLVLVNCAWNLGPIYGWTTPFTYILLITGMLVLLTFFFIEKRAKNPLVPFRSMSRDVLFVMGCIAAGWSSFGIWLFYTWQMMEVIRFETPLLASANFAPAALSGLCASIVTGLLLHKLGPAWTMLFSMLAYCAGLTIMATAPVDQIYWVNTFISIVVMPWGMDMSFPSATIILSNNFPRKHQGVAASLIITVVNYSISLGLGFAGTVESRLDNGRTDLLRGYKSAYYFGIGLTGLGVATALAFLFSRFLDERRKRNRLQE